MTIPLDEIVERKAERLKHHTVILMMIEGLNESHDATVALRICLVQIFNYVALSLRRVHVFWHWLYNLHTAQLTFTANSPSLYLTSTTLPKVPVPKRRVTLYLCPNFSPILNLKCGVFRRLLVEEEMELLELSEEEEEDEDELEGLRFLLFRGGSF
jgi:hypothetical protein